MERQAKDMNMKKIKHALLALLGLVLTLPLDAETGTDDAAGDKFLTLFWQDENGN